MILTFHITTPSDPMLRRGVDGYGGEGIVWPLLWAMEALVKVNEWHLSHGAYPPLYQSGLRYQTDPIGKELWTDIPASLSLGYVDCKKAVAWRIAELRRQGIGTRPYLDWKYIGKILLIHVLVMYPNGFIECPSSILGMNPPWTDDGQRHYRSEAA